MQTILYLQFLQDSKINQEFVTKFWLNQINYGSVSYFFAVWNIISIKVVIIKLSREIKSDLWTWECSFRKISIPMCAECKKFKIRRRLLRFQLWLLMGTRKKNLQEKSTCFKHAMQVVSSYIKNIWQFLNLYSQTFFVHNF